MICHTSVYSEKMIEIRYSVKHEKINEMADISGSWEDLENLRQNLLNFLENNENSFYCDADKNAEPDGWDFILERLKVNLNDQAAKVSVVENKFLKVEGSKENLEVFAAWLEFDKEIPGGYHSHYEYFEGNQYINSESMALIIGIK